MRLRSRDIGSRRSPRAPGRASGGDSGEGGRFGLRALLEIGFDGYAVGGLAVGEPESERLEVLEAADAPRCPGSVPATSWEWAGPSTSWSP